MGTDWTEESHTVDRRFWGQPLDDKHIERTKGPDYLEVLPADLNMYPSNIQGG